MKNNSLNVGYMKKYIFLLVLYGSQKAITSILPIRTNSLSGSLYYSHSSGQFPTIVPAETCMNFLIPSLYKEWRNFFHLQTEMNFKKLSQVWYAHSSGFCFVLFICFLFLKLPLFL